MTPTSTVISFKAYTSDRYDTGPFVYLRLDDSKSVYLHQLPWQIYIPSFVRRFKKIAFLIFSSSQGLSDSNVCTNCFTKTPNLIFYLFDSLSFTWFYFQTRIEYSFYKEILKIFFQRLFELLQCILKLCILNQNGRFTTLFYRWLQQSCYNWLWLESKLPISRFFIASIHTRATSLDLFPSQEKCR